MAFVGGRPAEVAIEQCRRLGFDGDLWPVHPTRDEVAGLPTVPTVDDLPGVPDAVLVAVNRHAAVDVVARLAAMGAGAAVCHASGYAEIDVPGRDLQAELVAAAGDMPVVGPNCYGTIAATVGAALWPDQQGLSRVDRGVALITQSGNIGVNLSMQTRPMDVSHLLTLGNQAVVGVEDCMEVLVDDPAVTGVGLHIEALHDVERFSEACHRAATLGIPVVALKTGASDQGARIAVSHTGSLVGSDAAYDALFRRLGVHRVTSVPELLDTLFLLERLGPLPGDRIVSLSCSGGEASVVADRAAAHGVVFPDFTDDHRRRVSGSFSTLVSVSNPFDYHTFEWGDEERLTTGFTAALDGPFDAALLVLDFPQDGLDDSGWWPTLRAFGAARRASGTPGVVAASMAENLSPAVEAAAVAEDLVPVRGIDAALAGLGAAVRWGRRAPGPVTPAVAVTGPTIEVMEAEAKRLLADAGVPVADGAVVAAADAADAADRLGYPVVAKTTGTAHKTEVGGVALGLTDRAAVDAAVAAWAGPVLIERQVDDAVAELLVAVRREPPVGWLLTLGAGGTLVEVIADTANLVLPVGDDEVREALAGLAIAPLLDGDRGRPAADIEAIIGVVRRLQTMVDRCPWLVELEINPLLATPDGAVAVDALAALEAT